MAWKRRFDDLMEAATLAEADLPDEARAIASRLFPKAPRRQPAGRILAVGASGFSPAMVERSVAMAERLDYGVVAMTTGADPAGPAAGGRLSRPRDLASVAFGARAAERGVPFIHLAWLGDPALGVAEAARRFSRIAFLLVESDLALRVPTAPGGLRVFCLEG